MHSNPSTPLALRRWPAMAAALALLCLLVAAPAAVAQMGPRTIQNSAMSLDANSVGDQLAITSSDKHTQKMDLLRELSYLEPEEWQRASVTWLSFKRSEDGAILISEEGRSIVRGLKASKKWDLEPLEEGGWKATPKKKKRGKMDLYLETQFKGEPFTVGAVVPKFDDQTFGAVYRGTDFLFFVVQKKHPEEGEASAG